MFDCVPAFGAGFRTAVKKVELPGYFSIILPELKVFLVLFDFWNKKPAW